MRVSYCCHDAYMQHWQAGNSLVLHACIMPTLQSDTLLRVRMMHRDAGGLQMLEICIMMTIEHETTKYRNIVPVHIFCTSRMIGDLAEGRQCA